MVWSYVWGERWDWIGKWTIGWGRNFEGNDPEKFNL